VAVNDTNIRLGTAWRAGLLRTMLLLGFLWLAAGLAPAQVAVKKTKAETEATVDLTVRVLEDDAKLWVNDKEVTVAGRERKFRAATVKSGEAYYLQFKVTWEPNNYTAITRLRKLRVEPGKSYLVDLRTRDDKTDPKDDIVVRYVPTPDEIVDKMAELAGVGKEDVVFDLGCGDGRMVCRAVAKFRAKRGVGVDIDPERVKDSMLTAKQYKVERLVAFREGDVLKPIKDLPEATVVMLYMGDDIGARLSPILQQTLKPGSRVVSHRFLLGDWKPDKTIMAQDENEIEYELHLWVVKEPEKKAQEKK
jgi:uncharacterized protein (TIGR03000 family)